MISIRDAKKERQQLSKVKKILKDNADAIQKSATLNHSRLIGSNPTPAGKIRKYNAAHIKIVKSIGNNLTDFDKGVLVFKKLGIDLAKSALDDGLTIEEAVDGTIFLKQAIWERLKKMGVLKEFSTQDLYEFSQTIGNYCDVLASQVVFTYHNYYTQTMSESEERFRSLIEKSTDAIALVTSKGKVVYASPATEKLMGYTPEEFKMLTNPFDLVPPNERKLVRKLFQKLLKRPGSTEHVVYRVLHKNGNQIWIESDMTNMIQDPNVRAVVLNYRDITERKTLETQKDDFISIATHELKTPVTSIKAYAQVLQSRFSKEGNMKAVQMLSRMDVQLKKLTGLIGDLLDVTRINGGKLQFHEGAFDFSELVNEIVDEMRLTTSKHNLVKNFKTTKIVRGDRDRIGQVITNLISNAIKYSPHDKEIIIFTSETDKEVKLCVKDSGIGIAQEQRDKVFERFFRVGEAEDTFAGLGLGLFISSEIIKRQGGRIWVEDNKKAKGSTFCFVLPAPSRVRLKKTAKPVADSAEEKKPLAKKWKVLVADDDPSILEAISLILEDAGYEVRATTNGDTVKLVSQYIPDVILLDIWMSGMDGRMICKSLKSQKKTAHIPIILVSANKDTEKIAEDFGAEGFLTKPFEMNDLLSIVASNIHVKKH